MLRKKAEDHFRKGESFFLSTQFERAKDFFEIALKAYWESGDHSGTAQCLRQLGRVLELMGNYAKAHTAVQESGMLFLLLNDKTGTARCKASLGSIGWARGHYEEASKLLGEALSLFKETNDVPGQAWVQDLMGNLHLAQGKDQEAERCHLLAFSLVESLGLTLENKAWNHYHLGALALFRKDWAQARDLFLEANDLFLRLKDDLGQVAALIHLGEIASAGKDYSAAEKYFQKAVQLVVPTQCKPLLADALTGVSQLMKGQGDHRKAIGLLMVALSHPTCRQQTKDRMVSLSEALEARFSPRELEDGFRWAKPFSLEEMAASWVSSISAKSKFGKLA